MPPVSAFAIVPLRMGLALVAGLSVLMPVAFLLLVALIDGSVDRVIVTMTVLIFGVGQASLGVPLMMRLVRPASYCHDMRAMLHGDGWVHWQYDEAQWREATRIEAQRARSGLGKLATVMLVVGVVVALVRFVASGGSGWALLVFGLAFAGIWGLVTLVMVATQVSTWARTRKTGEIYISRLGIYRLPGGYTPLTNAGYQLNDVTVVDTTPVVLRFEVANKSIVVPRSALADVAVPVGCEEEARQLADRFRTQLITRP